MFYLSHLSVVFALVAVVCADAPTTAPTASPTLLCSEYYQVFSVTETAIGPTCVGKTGGCSRTVKEVDKLAEQVGLGFAARAMHPDSSLIFALPGEDDQTLLPYERMVLDAESESDGAWATAANLPSTRQHEVTITYRPLSPVDHMVFAAAARDLIGTLFQVRYCHCHSTVNITATSSGYVIVSGTTGGMGGPCGSAGFTPSSTKTSTSKLSGAPMTSSASSGPSSAVIAAVVASAVVVASAIALVRRKQTETMATPVHGGSYGSTAAAEDTHLDDLTMMRTHFYPATTWQTTTDAART